MNMLLLEVGSRYPEPLPMVEGLSFNFDRGGASLIILLNSPTKKEISDYKSGSKVSFGLYKKGPVLFVLLKFGGQEWSDAPFHMHICGEFKGDMVEGYSPGKLLSLTVTLVDCSRGSNIIKNMRHITFSAEYSELFIEAVKSQLQEPISRADYERAIEETYTRYPDTRGMVRDALIVD